MNFAEELFENFSEVEIQSFIDWDKISAHQYLTEDFIRKFQDQLLWDVISHFQQLSEDFIEEFQHRI